MQFITKTSSGRRINNVHTSRGRSKNLLSFLSQERLTNIIVSCFTYTNPVSYSTITSNLPYSTYSNLIGYWKRLQSSIELQKWSIPFTGSLFASTSFKEPYPIFSEFEVLSLAYMQLIELYPSRIDSGYIKFTLGMNVKFSMSSLVQYTLGPAIAFCDSDGNRVHKKLIFEKILQLVRKHGEEYKDAVIHGVFIHVYYLESSSRLDFPYIPDLFQLICQSLDSNVDGSNLPNEVLSLLFKKARIPTQISSSKSLSGSRARSFIVADIETILVNNTHQAHACGFLLVTPGDVLTFLPRVHTFFSEDLPDIYPTFVERSERMMFDFCSNVELTVKKYKDLRVRTVYYHNLARFDGVLIIKHYSKRGEPFKVKTLIRNHMIYEIQVYENNKFLLRYRDSLTLLPGSLKNLGKALCPELGSKGFLPHDTLNESNLVMNRTDIITYLRQDVVLLGGIMLKAQEIHWTQYSIDIENVMTISALSLKIFRQLYFDDKNHPIYIPTRNQDTFIRRGYYGGHVDVYKPYGKDLYYYDVNSLYPYVMKSFPMPIGKPVWRKDLENVNLDTLFGFINAYIVCPKDIKKPVLPYKDRDGTLVYPTGKFVGVYFSEELKYARSIGYEVVPISGYLFEKMEYIFEKFITDFYDKRLEAKKAGDEAMSFIYKILMNSLYGRFGMNPESLVTEICKHDKYIEYMMNDNFQSADKLTDEYYIVQYLSNSSVDDNEWKAPRFSAVQLSAAITSYARIYMHPYVSRPDCIYTDTDSIVLTSPLPDELVSPDEIGKFKLEYNNNKGGIFLAPKSYLIETPEGPVMKFKGPGKELIEPEMYKAIFDDLSHKKTIETEANFRISWKTMEIQRKDYKVTIGLPKSNKREKVFKVINGKEVWVDTLPRNIIDIGEDTATKILIYELSNRNKDELAQSTPQEQKEEKTQNNTTNQPTLFNTKHEALKAKNKKANKDIKHKKRKKRKDDDSSPQIPKPDE